jgi:hypothetical protein
MPEEQLFDAVLFLFITKTKTSGEKQADHKIWA